MANNDQAPDLDTALRCLVLRTWAGYGGRGGQTPFAIKYGFTVKQWNNFERGLPLSKEAAIQLVRRIPGLTLDWLHLGSTETLSGKLRRELEEAEASLESPGPSGGARR